MGSIVQTLFTSEVLDRSVLELGLGIEVLQVLGLNTAFWLLRASQFHLLLNHVDLMQRVPVLLSPRQVVQSADLDVLDVLGFELAEVEEALQLSLLALVPLVLICDSCCSEASTGASN